MTLHWFYKQPIPTTKLWYKLHVICFQLSDSLDFGKIVLVFTFENILATTGNFTHVYIVQFVFHEVQALFSSPFKVLDRNSAKQKCCNLIGLASDNV
ncbi:hypothetical protein LSTR_LSTR011596 [Laodelphax striatellus]|uniref:Uncharacterized protein n=1 Tax=Laodelphax striatellus TaxID=195883 RepID=A0A482X5P5_LAOST|nr:hypothetical protein LSTR_LSTR011596 [Laodelphax striatellus]